MSADRHKVHVLYRFFDKHDALLYVGITRDPLARWKGHSADKSWYGLVSRATLEHFESRKALEAAELRAIQTAFGRGKDVEVIPRETTDRIRIRQ